MNEKIKYFIYSGNSEKIIQVRALMETESINLDAIRRNSKNKLF